MSEKPSNKPAVTSYYPTLNVSFPYLADKMSNEPWSSKPYVTSYSPSLSDSCGYRASMELEQALDKAFMVPYCYGKNNWVASAKPEELDVDENLAASYNPSLSDSFPYRESNVSEEPSNKPALTSYNPWLSDSFPYLNKGGIYNHGLYPNLENKIPDNIWSTEPSVRSRSLSDSFPHRESSVSEQPSNKPAVLVHNHPWSTPYLEDDTWSIRQSLRISSVWEKPEELDVGDDLATTYTPSK